MDASARVLFHPVGFPGLPIPSPRTQCKVIRAVARARRSFLLQSTQAASRAKGQDGGFPAARVQVPSASPSGSLPRRRLLLLSIGCSGCTHRRPEPELGVSFSDGRRRRPPSQGVVQGSVRECPSGPGTAPSCRTRQEVQPLTTRDRDWGRWLCGEAHSLCPGPASRGGKGSIVTQPVILNQASPYVTVRWKH